MAAKDSLQKVTTGDLGTGGTLPREMFDEFFTEVQENAELLDRVRTVPVGQSDTRIPKIGVGERLRRAQGEDSTQNESGVNTDYVDIDCEKGSVYWSLTRETVEENPEREDLANTILSLMSQQWAVDTEDLGVNGDESDADAFINQNDGWLTIASARGMPTYSHTDGSGNAQPVRSDLFHNAIQTMEDKYERMDPIFVMSNSQVQQYSFHLTERESGLGDSVLFGDSELTPFDYDVLGLPTMPDTEALFTPAQNLIYALRYDVRVDVLSESDETFDNDLFAKYKIVGKDDFEIEDENAGVHITDIAAP
ncbi:phage major capsid protein [Halostella sp. PRR32]|uniref:phage major capsid protein n=1 Tax=Halostella sp. PRR32 TaxID=3098147 RepID=UPI002B1E44BE|nr:phage major capsid protein [Halostella sp. PRR32]